MVLRLANFFMRLEARLSYALIGLVQATGYAGGLDCRLSADGEYEFVYGSCRKSGIALPASGGKDGNRECFMPLRKRGFHRNRQRRIGRNMAGTKFITLILVIPSIFRLMATISSEPTQVISATTASLRRGARLPAASVMIA